MIAIPQSPPITLPLAQWLENPPSRTEWVDGFLVRKSEMTLKHSKIQRRLSTLWSLYVEAQGQGGEVYTEPPCRTNQQGRSPDVAYLTPDLLAQYGEAKVLPQSFPLCAEVVSPTDLAEEVVAKAYEYLDSGSQEVWLVYPESGWIVVVTADSREIFGPHEVAKTQRLMLGFQVQVDELMA